MSQNDHRLHIIRILYMDFKTTRDRPRSATSDLAAAMTDGDGLRERVKMLDARPGKVKVFL